MSFDALLPRESCFVTGTDTGVGKTWFTARWIRALRAAGVDAVGFKPIVCGERTDAFQLANASGGLALDTVNPVWLKPPTAPYTAAMIEDRPVDLGLIRDAYAALRTQHEVVLVEGAGGWLVPVAHDFTLADLAVECALPVVCVVANRLGCLNHALLTRESVRARGLRFAGFVLNSGIPTPPLEPQEAALAALATNTNHSVLEQVSGERVWDVRGEAEVVSLVQPA
ncbi:MAG: dethiobiotin synthase [Verrucomicrobia bacterium]|nr:dethiobiotin synthase [Verrucomicrobiota bacterium]